MINSWQSLKTQFDDKEKEITRIEQLTDRSLVISCKQNKAFNTESQMYNPVIGAYVTAYARTTLLEKCLEVVGDRALYCDTGKLTVLFVTTTLKYIKFFSDSLVYLRIPPEPTTVGALHSAERVRDNVVDSAEPVRGEALGQLANELKENEFITCFQCIAPKTWRAEVSVKTGENPITWQLKRTIIKSKGMAKIVDLSNLSFCFFQAYI